MSTSVNHLPECGFSPGQPGWVTINDGVPQPYVKPSPCICDRLRACEQRVRLEDDDYAYVAAQAEAEGRRRGWNEALDAAEAAVVGIPYTNIDGYPFVIREEAIAAIRVLKDKP